MDVTTWDKISEDYHEEVLSPLKDSKENPLLDEMSALEAKDLAVIELGCGLGEFIPFLESRFREVNAIDFSPAMIERAKERNATGKTAFHVMDMTDVSSFHGKLDVAVAINSLLTSDLVKLNAMIAESYRVLKPGGRLFAIIPSMECHIYQNMLLVEQKIGRNIPQDKAMLQASKLLEHGSYDLFRGVIDFDGDVQRAFYRFEIAYRFGKVGFKDFRIERVPYEWQRWKEAGNKSFPKEEPPWDWYFSCVKPAQ